MWYLIASCLMTSLPLSSTVEIKQISVLSVTGIYGDSAALPCDVSHPHDDTIYLLLWFRDTLTTPIYRFDDRALARGKQSHWSDEDQLGSRAVLDVTSSPALLRLSSLTLSDQGFYKCRVDFKLQPTKTTRVHLTVVVPPKSVSVTVGGPGTAVRPVTRVVGPYLEGDTIFVTCLAHGGIPRPSVVWYEDTQVLDGYMESEESVTTTEIPDFYFNTTLNPWPTEVHPLLTSSAVPSEASVQAETKKKEEEAKEKEEEPYNTLTLGPLSRHDLKMLLTCETFNNNITMPVTLVVMIDMYLPPLAVEIRSPEEPLTAGKEYQVLCEIRGSRPPPSVSWWNGEEKLPRLMHTQTSGDGNITTSILILRPTSLDDGSPLRCLAESPQTNSTLEDVITLAVYYLPTATATFGSSLDEGNIKEGDDVYFECVIQANPRVTHVSWRHNKEELVHDVSGGIIVSNQSLVLQKVERSQAGKYTCQAHNLIGYGDSNSLQLDVKYAPVCSPGQVTTYAVGRNEDAEVACEVEANPLRATFRWTFNNTADTIDVPQGRYTSTSEHSVITYTPMTSLDYGTLLCWAKNEIGDQKEPCLYHIVPAGKPDPPGNCTVIQRARTSVKISCIAGSSGGLKQSFFLQARLHNGKHTINVTASDPVFQVEGLKPKQKYNLFITAHNDKGTSSQTHLIISSISSSSFIYHLHDGPSEAEVRDAGKTGEGGGLGGTGFGYLDVMSLTQLIPAALGVGAGLVLVIIILILLIIFRTRRPRDQLASCASIAGSDQSKTGSKSPSMTPKQTTSCSERDLQVESESDAEPDIIPLQEGFRGPDPNPPLPPTTLLPSDCYQYPTVPNTTTATHIHTLVSPHHSHRVIPPPAQVPLLEEGFSETIIPAPYRTHQDHHPPHLHHHQHPHLPHPHHPLDHQTQLSTMPSTLPRAAFQQQPQQPQGQQPQGQQQQPQPQQHHHSHHPTPPPPPLNLNYGTSSGDPHSHPYPGIEGNLPPPVEYQSVKRKRSAYGREASHSVTCEEEDTPTTPLLNKRESSV